MSSATFFACSWSEMASVTPGTTDTPASIIDCFESIFEHISSMAGTGGPMNSIPLSRHSWANSAFSARKP